MEVRRQTLEVGSFQMVPGIRLVIRLGMARAASSRSSRQLVFSSHVHLCAPGIDTMSVSSPHCRLASVSDGMGRSCLQPWKSQEPNMFSFYFFFARTPEIISQIDTNGTLPNSSHKAKVILLPKPHKEDSMKKENYRPISLMNIYAKILNKILVN